MRLLILNWRNPWYPWAGGAELVTYRVAQRLATWGWSVEWFSGAYPAGPAVEDVDGIRFVRAGSALTVQLAAWRRYRKATGFDVVLDEINTIPFYAHLYMHAPTGAYIHQLAQEVWLWEDLLGTTISFTGRVSNDERTSLLRRASCLWMTSVREGWGLAVTEAARHGTPAVAYRVPGLVDSVKDGRTGVIVDPDPRALALATAELFRGDFQRFAAGALEDSKNYDWDRTARNFEAILRARAQQPR
jgi:glycosyltransferase involved in cell wall biosynthesis